MPAPPLESLPAIVNAVFMFFASMRITPLHYFSFWTGDKESGAPSLPPGVRMNGYVKLFVFQHAQSLFFQILRCGNNVFLCKNGTDDAMPQMPLPESSVTLSRVMPPMAMTGI